MLGKDRRTGPTPVATQDDDMLAHLNNVFIDCGTNKGQGFRLVAKKFGINSNWVVELFEPNPLCDTTDHVVSYAILHQKAVWDKNGFVPFSLMLENDEGSSVNCLMDSGICKDPDNTAYRHHKYVIQVECIDISSILNQYNDDDFIVVKIDVEGAEFAIVRKMLKDGSIKKINHLLIEWHTIYLSSETGGKEAELKRQIRETGVNLHDWH